MYKFQNAICQELWKQNLPGTYVLDADHVYHSFIVMCVKTMKADCSTKKDQPTNHMTIPIHAPPQHTHTILSAKGIKKIKV